MERHVKTSKNVTWMVIVGLLVVLALALVLCLFMSRCCRRRKLDENAEKRHERYAYNNPRTNSKSDDSFQKPGQQTEKGKIFLNHFKSYFVVLICFFCFTFATFGLVNRNLKFCHSTRRTTCKATIWRGQGYKKREFSSFIRGQAVERWQE